VIPVLISDDEKAARAHAQQHFGFYETMPRYRRMLELGNATQMADVCVIGNEDSVAEQLRGFEKAGMSDFLAAPLAFESASWDATAERLATLLD
jgi:alkanesulfonate monooxygenase SsuD/methylene tetrahydromethanopterin reductase-like flavin-dependent oxidoreductase (luciferase family)